MSANGSGHGWRSSDLERLGQLADISSDGNRHTWPESLRELLEEIGVQEPGLPPHLDDGTLRVPAPVQFFRRHDDTHGIHYEGYTADNTHLWFYEVDEYYDLGEPYLFLAATNPSAVDVKCVAFPEAFRR